MKQLRIITNKRGALLVEKSLIIFSIALLSVVAVRTVGSRANSTFAAYSGGSDGTVTDNKVVQGLTSFPHGFGSSSSGPTFGSPAGFGD